MSVTHHERRLDNGLTILAETDPDAHSAAVGFFVRTGARDEEPALMGVSHFLEHMMFKGTDDLPAEAINRGFDAMGARNNAYTTGEMTAFYAHVLPERTPDALALLGAMMRPALRQSDFDTEKGVILEEIAMYRDNPFWVLYEQCVEKRYGPHGLGHRVLGTETTVGEMDRDAMMSYFDNRYSADNTVVALAGRVDLDEAERVLNEVCGAWQPTSPARTTDRPATHAERLDLRDEKVTRGYALLLSDAPAIDDDDRHAAGVLAYLLGGSDNSRLHWALVDPGAAEEAQASYDGHINAGDYFVFASCDPDKIDDVLGVIDRETASLIEGVTERDLERLRNRVATGVTLSGERPEGRMHRLGRQWATGSPYRSLADELESITSVTHDDLRRVGQRYPIARGALVGTLRPA
ncbi:MAG: pitrilysin family protein [Planctomycetota bacterium]